jgi:hypothetical protein
MLAGEFCNIETDGWLGGDSGPGDAGVRLFMLKLVANSGCVWKMIQRGRGENIVQIF